LARNARIPREKSLQEAQIKAIDNLADAMKTKDKARFNNLITKLNDLGMPPDQAIDRAIASMQQQEQPLLQRETGTVSTQRQIRRLLDEALMEQAR